MSLFNKIKLFWTALLLFPILVSGQGIEAGFPRDTSFNVSSAVRKIQREYPHATAVNAFTGLPVRSERDRVYCSPDGRDLHVDIFYPGQGTEPRPGVVLIHGGGWASGNKSHLVPLAQKLAAHGFVAATAEYRLSPEAKYPAAITDLKTVVKWLKFNASDYNLDTSRIATLGTSAGATLATLLGTTANHPKFEAHAGLEAVSDRVHAIVNIDGIVDFTDPAESGKDLDPAKPSAGARWFGATFKQNPEMWIEASPLTYVDGHTPPTLFVNSSLERFHAGRDAFLEVLEKHGTSYRVHTIPDTPHPFWLCYPWFDEVVPVVTSFLGGVFEFR